MKRKSGVIEKEFRLVVRCLTEDFDSTKLMLKPIEGVLKQQL